ncbi:MAG: sulfatase-like hydrolase/transferase [Chitinophagia bacterium]
MSTPIKIPKKIGWTLMLAGIFLILMSVLRISIGIVFKAPSSEIGSYLPTYFLGFRYDLRYVGIIMMLTFILSLFPKLEPFATKLGKKIAIGIWLFFSLTLFLFYATDFVHFAYLHQRLNASILGYLENLAISMQMMWQSYPIVWIVIGFFVTVFLLYKFILFTFNVIEKWDTTIKGGKIIHLLFFLLYSYCIVGNVVYSGGQYPLRWSNAYSLGSDYKANLALNPYQSFFSTMDFRNSKVDIELLRNNYKIISDYLQIPIEQQNASSLSFKRTYIPIANDTVSKQIKNVVLVICESFSMYKSSMVGNPLNATPYFNEMCKQGVFFNRAFSPAYGTARGVWAVITGIPDVQPGKTSSRNPLAVDQHSIITDFKNYEKYYFLGGSASWANIRGVLTNNISDLNIYEQGTYQSKEVDVWGISDHDLFKEANQTLKTRKLPFFAIIQTADNHRPYTIPAADLPLFQKRNVSHDSLQKFGFETNDEYNAFRYTDFCIAQFIESAKKESYFNNTLFVFVGDHGIRGDAGTMLPRVFSENGLTNMHVPILFYAPHILKPKNESTPVSQVDVLPSIASLTNIAYTNTTLGRNVFSLINKSNTNQIFLFDDFANSIGLYSNTHYLGYPIKDADNYKFKSTEHNEPIKNDSIANSMKRLTGIIYETSKYMLVHNKKEAVK